MSYVRENDVDYQLAKALTDGAACQECQSEFVRPHGFPVLCHYCFPKLTPNQRMGAKLATHLEIDVHYHQQRAKQHRKSRLERPR